MHFSAVIKNHNHTASHFRKIDIRILKLHLTLKLYNFQPLGVANLQDCTILHLEKNNLFYLHGFRPRGVAVSMPPRPHPPPFMISPTHTERKVFFY